MTYMSSVIVLATFLLRCSAVEEEGSVTASGIWSTIGRRAANAADRVTSLFSSPKSEAGENGHCRTDDGGCQEVATKEADAPAVMETRQSLVGLFNDAFEGMKRKITTTTSEMFENVRMAVRSVFYEELGKLFTPDLSTPGRLLLNAINILPEAMQSLILFAACLVLAFVTIRYFSLWWGLVFCAVVYVYYRLLGPYRVIRMGVVGMEMVMRWMSYVFHYPMLSAVIIALLLLGALCWPLWSWYSAYKEAKRQDHMYSLIYSTHEAILTIRQRQDELIKAVHELQEKRTNT